MTHHSSFVSFAVLTGILGAVGCEPSRDVEPGGSNSLDAGSAADAGSTDGGRCAPTLQIEADPATQLVKAGNFVTLRVSGTALCSPFPDGLVTGPTLTTDYGSFEKPASNHSVADDVRERSDGVIFGHVVTVRLYADPQPGTAHVTATYADPFGASTTASTDVTFTADVPGGAAKHLNFSCLTYNIGVLATQATSIQIPCSAVATDEANHAIQGATINFIAEAGTMKFSAGNVFYFPRDQAAPHAAPRDVNPDDLLGSEEPWRSRPAGGIANPRDGLVTIIAYTPATKDVVNALALSEPYVDANDNREFDQGEDYVDLNGDTQWNELQSNDPSEPHALWRKIKMLWTGSLQSSSPVAIVDPPFADVGYLQAQSFVISLLDQNYNVLASNDAANDGIVWGYAPQPDISLASGQAGTTSLFEPDDPRRLGMLLDSNFEFIDPTSSFNWRMGGSAAVFVQDTMQCNTPLQSESFTVTGQVVRTLLLNSNGDPQGYVSESMIPAGGSLQPPPSSSCE